MRVLVFSSLFPSEVRPRHGIFVETRLCQLIRDCGIDARVIAPVPWFPFRGRVFGDYAKMGATPPSEVRDNGLQVTHPRYLMLPRVGVPWQPDSMAFAGARGLASLIRAGWVPDVIDAHYFYPDGVAAALLSERFGIPLVITARGTDVNVLGALPSTARRIVWAARRASTVVAVSGRLKDKLTSMGVDESRVMVLRNGVDLELFGAMDQSSARAQFALPAGKIAISVGNLVPEKGQALAIESLARLEGVSLVIVGDGPSKASLQSLAEAKGVGARVRFLPTMRQKELSCLYAAADVLLLTSTREGWPNVVLEALACGTPVVATDVGAVAEMLTESSVGRVVQGRDPALFAAAVNEMLEAGPRRDRAREHAARFDWPSISRAQLEIFTLASSNSRSADAVAADDEPLSTSSA